MALLIFDGDDTLWSTEPLYDEARQAARRLVEANGLDGARWEAAERARNVAVHGMSASRCRPKAIERSSLRAR